MDEPPSQSQLLNILSGFNQTYTSGFVVIAILLLLSGLISASEVAFFSLKSTDLEASGHSGQRGQRKKMVVELLSRPRLLLATIQIMNNAVNIGMVTVTTYMMWKLSGSQKPAELIVGLITLVATIVITFFGEIIPKAYATKHNVFVANRMAYLWRILIALCRPLSFLLLKMSHSIEKKFEKKGYHSTVEELNQALEMAASNDVATEDEKEILRGIVNFGTLTVKQVMKSRLDIAAVNIALDFHELMDYINKQGFSRLPVYKDTIDKIEGVLYIKDLLPFIDHDEHFEWSKLLRPGFFIPETKKIDSLLKDFQEKRVHMALVVDEYGGTSGLITLEDIIEEIIGEINDEFDDEGLNYHKIDDHTFVFEGKIPLHDFCKAVGVDSSLFEEVKGESESLAGLILELNHGLAAVGTEIQYDQFTFIVEAADKKRIKRIRVLTHEEDEKK